MAAKSAYLDLTIISAADLKRGWLSGGQTAAVAWVDPSEKRTTSIVGSNGSNVQWPHEKLILSLNGFDNLSQGKLLTIEIHARGTWGDSLLGSVYVPLIELASNGEKSGKMIMMYQIVNPSGKRQGSMKFFAKVVQPRVSVVSAVPTPSAPPIPYPSYGMGSMYPPNVHPPVNMIYPSHTSPSPCWPHSNYTGNTPYPPSQLASETPYPPPTSVYPPPTTFSEAPYPPIGPNLQLPQIVPQHPSQMYPPSYGQQPATGHYH